MKAVVDTNVLVSGLIQSAGFPARVADRLRSGRLRLIMDDRVFAEYADVLRRRPFRRYFSLAEAETLLDFLSSDSERIVATVLISTLPDAGDIPFLETALSAEAPLVTGNLKHFPAHLCQGCPIFTPRRFIEEFFGPGTDPGK